VGWQSGRATVTRGGLALTPVRAASTVSISIEFNSELEPELVPTFYFLKIFSRRLEAFVVGFKVFNKSSS
jgi:hypothetical protein